ncbi:Uncharacterized protein Adt_46001 [Abeliophyllum distichum]|uniref:Uncharacterized protein n=1 Tax=Abeliophyllum distichum TaxID=126358 RepID=A0ABD1P2Z7_9LAMI
MTTPIHKLLLALALKEKPPNKRLSAGTISSWCPTGKIVNDLPEFKAQCKHCQEKFAWQKGIGTTHLNIDYKKCQYKYRGLDTNQAQLQFESPGVGSSTPTLNNWIYSQELKLHEGLPELIANVEFPLCLMDNPHCTKFVQKYLQPR